MKAKYIKRLRKKIAAFVDYEVAETISLFGEPYRAEYFGASVKSDTPLNAIKKYIRFYSRHYKQTHPNYDTNVITTTIRWGKFRVTNKKNGFKTYYM